MPTTPAKPAVANNPAKAKYLTALLVGPVYQAFDGVTGLRESGLLHASGGHSPAYAEKVFTLVKAVAKASVDLIYSGSRQYDDRKKDLAAQVGALRDFLEKNAPADRHLVPDGVKYPLPEAQAAQLPAPKPPAAKPREHRPRWAARGVPVKKARRKRARPRGRASDSVPFFKHRSIVGQAGRSFRGDALDDRDS